MADRPVSLRALLSMMRDAAEGQTEKIRATLVVFLTRVEGTDEYVPAFPALICDADAQTLLEFIYGLHGSGFISRHTVNAVAFFFDTWGYPRDIQKVLVEEWAEIDKKFGSDSEESKHFLDGKPRPSDFPEEERAEASMYLAAADNGDYVGASQYRGPHNPLWWADEEQMDPTLRKSLGAVGVKLRGIMEGVL